MYYTVLSRMTSDSAGKGGRPPKSEVPRRCDVPSQSRGFMSTLMCLLTVAKRAIPKYTLSISIFYLYPS